MPAAWKVDWGIRGLGEQLVAEQGLVMLVKWVGWVVSVIWIVVVGWVHWGPVV